SPYQHHVIRGALTVHDAPHARGLTVAPIRRGGCRICGQVHLLGAPTRLRPDAATESGDAFLDVQHRWIRRAALGIRSGRAPAIPQMSAYAERHDSWAFQVAVE